MKNINLRKVPDDLYTALNIEAATKDMWLSDVCIEHLRCGVGLSANGSESVKVKPPKKKSVPIVVNTPEEAVSAIANEKTDLPKCSECGSVGRVHQKNCSRG